MPTPEALESSPAALDQFEKAIGGGDAGERARALVEEFRAYLCEKMVDLDDPEVAWMAEKLEAALRDAHREGATAMREADARVAEQFHDDHERSALEMPQDNPERVRQFEFANVARAIEISIRALPIPGKTDAKRGDG